MAACVPPSFDPALHLTLYYSTIPITIPILLSDICKQILLHALNPSSSPPAPAPSLNPNAKEFKPSNTPHPLHSIRYITEIVPYVQTKRDSTSNQWTAVKPSRTKKHKENKPPIVHPNRFESRHPTEEKDEEPTQLETTPPLSPKPPVPPTPVAPIKPKPSRPTSPKPKETPPQKKKDVCIHDVCNNKYWRQFINDPICKECGFFTHSTRLKKCRSCIRFGLFMRQPPMEITRLADIVDEIEEETYQTYYRPYEALGGLETVPAKKEKQIMEQLRKEYDIRARMEKKEEGD